MTAVEVAVVQLLLLDPLNAIAALLTSTIDAKALVRIVLT